MGGGLLKEGGAVGGGLLQEWGALSLSRGWVLLARPSGAGPGTGRCPSVRPSFGLQSEKKDEKAETGREMLPQ